MSKKEDLKKQILQLTREYYTEVHGQLFGPDKQRGEDMRLSTQ